MVSLTRHMSSSGSVSSYDTCMIVLNPPNLKTLKTFQLSKIDKLTALFFRFKSCYCVRYLSFYSVIIILLFV